MKGIVIALLGGLLLVGCAPRPNAPSPPTPAEVPPPPALEPQPRPAAPNAPAFDESLLRGREFLLEARVGVLPELRDRVLGPLDPRSSNTALIEGFFHDATDGTLESDRLDPHWAEYLRSWASRFHATWNTVRVGRPLPGEHSTLTVPVRLIGKETSLRGWVILTGTPALVSDVQVEEITLGGPFDPESPDQEISSPSLR